MVDGVLTYLLVWEKLQLIEHHVCRREDHVPELLVGSDHVVQLVEVHVVWDDVFWSWWDVVVVKSCQTVVHRLLVGLQEWVEL